MATAHPELSERDAERIYTRLVHPDRLEGVARSATPTAVLIGGQPGAGRAYAMARVRDHLQASAGPSVAISADELREYHPRWRTAPLSEPDTASAVQPDVRRWYARLTQDAVAAGVNITVVSSFREPRGLATIAAQLKSAGYQVAAVVLATHLDQSRQATLLRYEMARTLGLTPRFVPAVQHDSAYRQLPETLSRLEADRHLDRIQVVARDGRQLYANQRDGDAWRRTPQASAALIDFRERRLSARELADTALRWQLLAQRLASDAAVPRMVASQASTWGREAEAAAERDAEAARLLRAGKEAQAFRTLPRALFEREFPQHAKALERLDEAVRFADKSFAQAEERRRFVTQTRERIAERIAEGRMALQREPKVP